MLSLSIYIVCNYVFFSLICLLSLLSSGRIYSEVACWVSVFPLMFWDLQIWRQNNQKPICYVQLHVFHHVKIAAFQCLTKFCLPEFQQEPVCCLFSFAARPHVLVILWNAETMHGSLDVVYLLYIYVRRKFRSQTSDNMDRWKAEQGRGREKRKIRREKIRRERVRKKMQMREKVGKSRNTVFFQWFVAPDSRKVGSLKRRVRSQLAGWEMKNCTPLWREAHFQVKMYKTHQVRTTFGSWDVEKVHAVVARSTFPSQNVQNTRGSDHFWKLRCRKSARRCGAKHISKSKCRKHQGFGPLLEVAMSKKCTPLWREAHFEVKM